MIRTITPADQQSVVALAVTAGLFATEDSGIVAQLLEAYFRTTMAEGHVCVVDEDEDTVAAAVAYYAPTPATDRTWELLMIAVQPEQQGRGRGAALLQYIEAALQAQGQRLLIVQTSGLPHFARTRAFYSKCSYVQEARIRDYYADGEDMIMFCKALGVR
jgi:ribosomal protein S18 acetylase RimI-like enzyme